MAHDDSTVVSVFVSEMHDIQGQPDIQALLLASFVNSTLVDNDAVIGHDSKFVRPKAMPELVLVRRRTGIRHTSVEPDFGESTPGNSASEFFGNFLAS